jgi:hypothetical protein
VVIPRQYSSLQQQYLPNSGYYEYFGGQQLLQQIMKNTTKWLYYDGSNPNTTNAIATDPPKEKKKKKTLALLYPVGLTGGYRNQAMRFIAFTKYAIDHNITQLLLESIAWTTRQTKDDSAKWHNILLPVLHEELFDINHWNTYSESIKNIQLQNATTIQSILLPTLVKSFEGKSDCWKDELDTKTVNQIKQLLLLNNATTNDNTTKTTGIPPPIIQNNIHNVSKLHPLKKYAHEYLFHKLEKPFRKLDLRPHVKKCKNPMVYGGGTTGKLSSSSSQLLSFVLILT